jgi:hypothetical protein
MSTQALAGRRSGWLMFAAVVMFAVAGVRLISGIAFLADSAKVADVSQGLFGDDLFWWGLWDLGIAALALYAGWSLLQNNEFGRIAGYVWAIVVIVQSFLYINWAPWWAFGTIVLASFVIYGLAVTADEG